MARADPYAVLNRRRRRRRRWWVYLVLALFLVLGLSLGAGAGALWYYSQDVPSLESVQDYQPSLVSRVYADDRQVIGQFYVERRILTPLAQIPETMKQAVIAVEDARFFEHPGLDVIGILRAFWTNLRRGGKVEGASTITQQLARSLFLSPERTYSRKIKELILAYKMELVLTKEQILETYLNQIYFGQGAYGVGAAAQTYFGKDLAELTLSEMAFLAGLPKSPNNYSPFKNFDRAKKRQEHVLARMREAGFISGDEYEEALAQPLQFRRPAAEQVGQYFIEYVRQHLMNRFGETAVYKGGLDVFTTLNVDLQKLAEETLRLGLRQLDKRQGWRGPLGSQALDATVEKTVAAGMELKTGDLLRGVVTKVGKDHVMVRAGGVEGRLAFDDMAWAKRRLKGRDVTKDFVTIAAVRSLLKPGDVIEVGVKKAEGAAVQFVLEQTPSVEGALVAIDPRNGAIRAMVGGYDFSRSEYNRAVLAHRQPGSAFKPVIYATAVQEGMAPATILVDAPVVYEQADDPEKTWKPENYEHKFYGAISMREALIHSRNAATVRLLEKVGVGDVIDFARTIGITSPLNRDLSLALGSSGVTLLELTSAYGVFANQGMRVEPFSISTVQDHNGEVLEQSIAEPRQIVSKEVSYLLTNMLEDVIQRGTGQLARVIDRPVAGKTGTTNEFTDAWFIGYTPNLVVGVWVGFDDIRTLGDRESGAHAALPIWTVFMRQALQQLPVMPFEIPDAIQFVRVDPATGLLLPEDAGQGMVEIFAKGTEPTQASPRRVDPADFYTIDQIQDGAVPAGATPQHN
jgi:penicillin-binding protein 1A